MTELGAEEITSWNADDRPLIADAMIKSCVEDRWSSAILACAAEAQDADAISRCFARLGGDQAATLGDRLRAALYRPANAAITTGVAGIAACDAYVAAFEAFVACSKVPRQAADAQQQTLAAMKTAWTELRDPGATAEARQAVADGCQALVEALEQGRDALGCAEPTTP